MRSVAGSLKMGYVDGRNVTIEHRSSEGRNERFHDIAADLVRRRVDVICATNNVAALAVKTDDFEDSVRLCGRD